MRGRFRFLIFSKQQHNRFGSCLSILVDLTHLCKIIGPGKLRIQWDNYASNGTVSFFPMQHVFHLTHEINTRATTFMLDIIL